MAKQANRKMIGAFVVIAVAILAASIVIFGSGDLFKEKREYVLYFEGSVKGLTVGSPVLFQGVEVGKVTRVVIRSYVKNLKSYIPVFVEVDPEKFEIIGESAELVTPQERIKKLIEMGLRAQLVTESMITGQLAIQVGMHPGAPLSMHHLDKGYTEIPTIPSTMERLGKALAKLDLQELEARLNSILASADRLLNNPDIGASLHELSALLQDARGLMANVNGKVDPLAENLNATISDARGLVDNVNNKVDPMAANLNATISDARGLVKNVDQQVKPLAGKATSSMDDISKLVRDVDSQVDPISRQVSDTLKSIESAFRSVNDLVGKDSPTRGDLDTTLKELSGAARSLRILADYLEEHPDSLIKGKGYKNY